MSAGDFTPGAMDELQRQCLALIEENKGTLIRAVKHYRNATGKGLRDSLDAVKAMQPSPSEAAGDAPVAAHGMRAAFMAWVKDRGCDTDGAWSAWQGCWSLLHPERDALVRELVEELRIARTIIREYIGETVCRRFDAALSKASAELKEDQG